MRYKHGMAGTTIWGIWQAMRQRCYDPNHANYPRYGGRGIRICERWRDSFANFYADMGDRPEGHSLERKRNNEDYSPTNCCWATAQEQASNRRSSVLLSYGGETMTLTELSRRTGQTRKTIQRRLKAGRSVEEAVCRGRVLPIPGRWATRLTQK